MLIKAASIKAGDVIITAVNTPPLIMDSVSFLTLFDRASVRCRCGEQLIELQPDATVVRIDRHRVYFSGIVL